MEFKGKLWNGTRSKKLTPNPRYAFSSQLTRTVGVGYWHPDAGWMLEIEMGETDIEPLYWMELPFHPSLAAQGKSRH